MGGTACESGAESRGPSGARPDGGAMATPSWPAWRLCRGWVAAAVCGLGLVVASTLGQGVAAADEKKSEAEMMRKLDRIMESLERIAEGMGRAPGGWERRPDGPPPGGPRREMPPEMRERTERWRSEAERRLREMPPEQRERLEAMMQAGRKRMEEGRRQMEEGRRRMEEAKEKFQEMERRIKKLEAEVARLKAEKSDGKP